MPRKRVGNVEIPTMQTVKMRHDQVGMSAAVVGVGRQRYDEGNLGQGRSKPLALSQREDRIRIHQDEDLSGVGTTALDRIRQQINGAIPETALGHRAIQARRGQTAVGDRIDLGVDLFSPRREASRSGSDPALGPVDGTAESDSNYFLVPEFGYNKMINPNLSLGVTVYANGGMNTDYPGGQIPAISACFV